MEIRSYIKLNLIIIFITVVIGLTFNGIFNDSVETSIKKDCRDFIAYVNEYKFYNGDIPDKINDDYKLRGDNQYNYVKYSNGYKVTISNDKSDYIAVYDSRTGKVFKMINTKYEYKNIYNDLYNDFMTSSIYYDNFLNVGEIQ